MQNKIRFFGRFFAECLHPDGRVAWRRWIPNAIVDAGLTDILSVYFAGGSQKPLWYLALIDQTAFTGVDGTDTMSSHAGWQESTAYNETTRASWVPSVAGGFAGNASSQVFTFSRPTTLAGFFVASNSTKGGTTGSLWSSAIFPLGVAFAAGQTLRLSYSIQAAGGG